MNKAYFQQLRQVFKNDPYQDRFLQELQDHAHDLELELPKSKKLTLNEMKKQFGKPKEVKKTFTQITRPWKKMEEKFKILGYSVLLILWVFISPPFFENFVASFIDTPFGDLFESILFGLMLIFIFFYFPFYWVWKRVLQKEWVFLSAKKVILWVFCPIFLTFLLSSWELYRRWRIVGYLQHPEYYPMLLLMLIFAGGVSLWVYLRKEKGQKIIPSSFTSFASCVLQWMKKRVGFFIFVYVLIYSAIRILSTLVSLKLNDVIRSLFLPLTYFEQGVYFFPSVFTYSVVGRHYLYIFFMIGAFLFSLIYLYKTRKFSWPFLTLIIYVLAIVAIPELRWSNSDLIFSVESKEISTIIEKRQYGPFYNLVQHLEIQNQSGLRYQVESTDQNTFILSQVNLYDHAGNLISEPNLFRGATFEFNPVDDSMKRLRSSEKKETNSYLGANELNELGFICKNNRGKEIPFPLPPNFSDEQCSSFFFKEELLAESKWGFNVLIHNFALSEDQNSLLMVLGPERGSDRVYWLDLSQINSNLNG